MRSGQTTPLRAPSSPLVHVSKPPRRFFSSPLGPASKKRRLSHDIVADPDERGGKEAAQAEGAEGKERAGEGGLESDWDEPWKGLEFLASTWTLHRVSPLCGLPDPQTAAADSLCRDLRVYLSRHLADSVVSSESAIEVGSVEYGFVGLGRRLRRAVGWSVVLRAGARETRESEPLKEARFIMLPAARQQDTVPWHKDSVFKLCSVLLASSPTPGVAGNVMSWMQTRFDCQISRVSNTDISGRPWNIRSSVLQSVVQAVADGWTTDAPPTRNLTLAFALPSKIKHQATDLTLDFSARRALTLHQQAKAADLHLVVHLIRQLNEQAVIPLQRTHLTRASLGEVSMDLRSSALLDPRIRFLKGVDSDEAARVLAVLSDAAEVLVS